MRMLAGKAIDRAQQREQNGGRASGNGIAVGGVGAAVAVI